MYKSLSEAMQERQRRNIATSTRNTAGVDETVWKNNDNKPQPKPKPPPVEPPEVALDDPDEERVRLVALKLELENSQRKVVNDIGWADRNYRRHGRRADNYHDLLRQRDANLDRLNELQQKLVAIKLKVRRKAEDADRKRTEARKQATTLDGGTLAETFMQLAKEMLADPVYQRVMVAAIHRLRERAGK
jgi:hypothetical protein